MHRSGLLLAMILGCGCGGSGPDDDAVSGSAGLSAGSSPEETSSDPSTSGPDSGAGTSSAGPSGSSGDDSESTGEDPSTSGQSESSSGELGESTSTSDSGSSTTAGDESSTGGSELDGIIDIGIIAHNDCTFTVEPASITVPEGTEFTVNWVSSPASEVEFDIAKIDPFNQVPIVIGMEPGTAYHDEVREWCGQLFTGTFDFRLTSCFEPLYIPVDCGG